MGFYTTLDFKGNKQINIDTNGREHYPITVILSAPGDGTKLSPLIILKDGPGKSVENNSRKLPCVINKNMYIFNKLLLGVIYLMNGYLKFFYIIKIH